MPISSTPASTTQKMSESFSTIVRTYGASEQGLEMFISRLQLFASAKNLKHECRT